MSESADSDPSRRKNKAFVPNNNLLRNQDIKHAAQKLNCELLPFDQEEKKQLDLRLKSFQTTSNNAETGGSHDSDNIIILTDIFDEENGSVLDKYRKRIPIFGPPAFRHYAETPQHSLSVRSGSRPLYNLYCDGAKIALRPRGGNRVVQHLANLIHWMGGQVQKHVLPETIRSGTHASRHSNPTTSQGAGLNHNHSLKATHLIVSDALSSEIEDAALCGVAIVKESFIEELWQHRNDRLAPGVANDPTWIQRHVVKCFEGARICVIGFKDRDMLLMKDALKEYNAIYEPEPSSSVTHYVIDKLSQPDCRIETLLKTREFTEIRIRYADTAPLTFKLYPNQLLLNQDWYYNSLIKGILQKPARYVAFDEGNFTGSNGGGSRLSSSMSLAEPLSNNTTMKPLNNVAKPLTVDSSGSPINFAHGSSATAAGVAAPTSGTRRASFSYGCGAGNVEDMSMNSFQSYDTVNVDSPAASFMPNYISADAATHAHRLYSTPNSSNVLSPNNRAAQSPAATTSMPRNVLVSRTSSAMPATTATDTDDSDGGGPPTADESHIDDAENDADFEQPSMNAVDNVVAEQNAAAAAVATAEATAIKRYRKMFELLHKHASNLRLLKYLCDDARAKLDLVNKENIKRSGVEALDASDLKLIFSQLPQLEEVHRDLLHALREAVGWNGNEPAGWSETSTCIGRLFLDFLPETEKVYARFCSQVEVMRERIRAAEMRSPLFHAHLKFITLDRKVLPDLLVEVFQYLPQTTMILADLERYTPDEHPDKVNLSAAVEKVRAIAANANEFHKQISSHMRTMNFLNRIDKLPAELIAHHRTPICDVEVREVYPGQFVGQNARLAFFLFPDGLEVAKRRRTNNAPGVNGRTLAESVAASVGATLSRAGGAALAANLAAAADAGESSSSTSKKPYKHIAWIPLRCIYLMHLVVADVVAGMRNAYSFIGGGDSCYADYYDIGEAGSGSDDDDEEVDAESQNERVSITTDAASQSSGYLRHQRRRRHSMSNEKLPNATAKMMLSPTILLDSRMRRSSSVDMPEQNDEMNRIIIRRPSVVSTSSSVADNNAVDKSEAMSLGSSADGGSSPNKPAQTVSEQAEQSQTTDDDDEDVYEEAAYNNNRHVRSAAKFSNASSAVLACVTEEEDDDNDDDEGDCESDARIDASSFQPSLSRTQSQKSTTSTATDSVVTPLVPVVSDDQKKSARIFSINIAMGEPGSDKSLNGQYYFEFVPKLSSFVDAAEIHNPYQFLQKLAQQICQQTQNRHTVDELILTTLESTHAHAQKYHHQVAGKSSSTSGSILLNKAQKKLSRALSFTRIKRAGSSTVTTSSSSTQLSSLTKSISSNNSGKNYADSNFLSNGDGTLKRVGSNSSLSSLVFSPFSSSSKRRYNTLYGGSAGTTLTPIQHRTGSYHKYHTQSINRYEVNSGGGAQQPNSTAEPTTMSVDSMSMSSALSGTSAHSTVSLGAQFHHHHRGGGGGSRSLFGTIRDSVRSKFGRPINSGKPLARELFSSPLALATAAAASSSSGGATEDDGVVCDNDSIMSGSFKSATGSTSFNPAPSSTMMKNGKFGFLQQAVNSGGKHGSRKKRNGSSKDLDNNNGDGDNVSIRTCL